MDGTAIAQYVGIAIAGVITVGSGAYKVVHTRISKLTEKHDNLNERVLTKCVHKDDYQRDIDEIKKGQADTHKEIVVVKDMLLKHWGGGDER